MAFLPPLLAAAAAGGGAAAAGTSLATALAIGSAALTGVSAIQQGNYQAAVAKNNAQVAERNAALESEASQREGIRSDREYAVALGEQLAAQGASGLDILGRTQLATRNVTRTVGREAAGDIRASGTAAARRLLQDASNFRAEGKQARTQGYVTAAGAALDAGREWAKESGKTRSLATSKRKPRSPWDKTPNWYGK
jgi:hypothetical protein